MRIGSICSGAGIALFGVGESIWGIECDHQIASVYSHNHPQSQLILDYVQNVEAKNLPPVDVIIATPSCKNASIANAAKGSGEQTNDIEVSKAISALIKEQLPRFFILENVQGYVNFESFKIIRNILAECGYHSDFQLLNLKDFGIAQNRKRLYLMAALHQFFPPMMQVSEKFKGWYEAIVDLIDSLPETNLANWQLRKFPCLIPNNPAFTIRSGQPIKALIKRAGGGRGSDRIYSPDEPAPTIRALGSRHSHQLDAVISDVDFFKILNVTPQTCLRFFGDQVTADRIWLPQSKSLAMQVVGNTASWEIMKIILNHISQ